jgi:hypothetical protein
LAEPFWADPHPPTEETLELKHTEPYGSGQFFQGGLQVGLGFENPNDPFYQLIVLGGDLESSCSGREMFNVHAGSS